ncbi:MAG: uroporphyrinogen-III synthase [Acidobacteria bacterium]|nr:uroporphyrinogen-III synthase [Acidobacteriota bacterium]
MKNKQIVLTRPVQQSAELRAELERRGAVVHEAPLIRTELIESAEVETAVSRLDQFDWLVFTSANGVEYFRQKRAQLQARGPTGLPMPQPAPTGPPRAGDRKDAPIAAPARWKSAQPGQSALHLPSQIQIAVIGAATAAAVERWGWKVSLIPESANSEGLAAALESFDVAGKKFALFVAAKTRGILPAALQQRGAVVTEVALYRTAPDPEGTVALQTLPWEKIDAVVFMSGSAAEVFAVHLPRAASGGAIKLCAAGPSTSRRMAQLGLRADLVASEPSVRGIVKILEEGV